MSTLLTGIVFHIPFERKLLISSLMRVELPPSGSYIRSRHLPDSLCVSCPFSTTLGQIIRRLVSLAQARNAAQNARFVPETLDRFWPPATRQPGLPHSLHLGTGSTQSLAPLAGAVELRFEARRNGCWLGRGCGFLPLRLAVSGIGFGC